VVWRCRATNVITALNDGRVVACDNETGDIAWEQQVGKDPGEGFTSRAAGRGRQDPCRPILW
jgi:outer membrane protein assembly factor BamB